MRRENGVWGGDGAVEGLYPHDRNFFLTFWLKIVHFGVYSYKNSQFSIHYPIHLFTFVTVGGVMLDPPGYFKEH